MMTAALPFPASHPASYTALPEEPAFDPALHLAMEAPTTSWSLRDFGYSAAEVAACASPVAIAGPFRLLSAAGVAAAREVALALKERSLTSDRTAHYTPGGVYQSKFMRDLCNSPEVAAFFSQIAGCELAPHTMPSMQLYINYAPDDITKAVDTWHTDSIGFDTVILASDPAQFSGGKFQYFRGTRQEAAALLETRPEDLAGAIAKDLPPERVSSVQFPAAGYAVFQQGTMVVHRASRLERRGERNTMVIGFVARDVTHPDPTRDTILSWGEPGVAAEFARHKAWLSQQKLGALLQGLDMNTPADEVRRILRAAIADAQHAIDIIPPSPA